jgi:hypothetical protein
MKYTRAYTQIVSLSSFIYSIYVVGGILGGGIGRVRAG